MMSKYHWINSQWSKQQTPVALFTTVIAFYHSEQMTIRMITYVLVIDDCMIRNTFPLFCWIIPTYFK